MIFKRHTSVAKHWALRCVFALVFVLLASGAGLAEPVAVVVPANARAPEKLAAKELADYLARIYPDDSFRVKVGPPEIGARRILLGTPESAPALAKNLDRAKLAAPEAYLVKTVRGNDGASCAVIAGADPSGVLRGVYGLLEHLGFGFYPGIETAPEPRPGKWTPEGWDLADHPLVATRLVFNWHNFLSGCTGWNFPQWEQWVTGAQKTGFNTVMVHAYGNNPMFTFSFKGIEKPVGFLATSRRGRDWGNEHVNDVRRLPGGEVFDAAEFGCDAALVPDGQRIAAAQALMKRVFALAEERGMDVCFAIDVDTVSMLPQNMIQALPEGARFRNGSLWLPRPDTEAGYGFYKAQVEALFDLYPQIDILALWRRSRAQEWGKLKKPEQLPEAWRAEYARHIAKNPAAGKFPQAVASFALGKVAAAFRRALDETGHGKVRIAMGSWETQWVPACAEFLPKDITLMPLDSNYLRYRRGSFFKVPAAFTDLESARGRILPIIWAHHDDVEYIGRPIHAHENFHDTLAKLDARGYGVIHWMTRPLDLYFKNHEKQVWASSRNESTEQTCRRAARDWFGTANEEPMGRYLHDWWTDAPIFGRATTDHFFLGREGIPNPDKTIAGCRTRLARLKGADTSSMTDRQRERLHYFTALEEILISFWEVQERSYRTALKAMKSGDYKAARAALGAADPADTIRRFASLSRLAGGDRGEQAMVLSLGTRWITDYLAAAQAAGAEPVRINFAPTRHEPLSQGAGRYTFHIDKGGNYWSVRGQRETKRKVVELAATPENAVPEEISQSGILIDKPTTLPLTPLVSGPKVLAPGDYRLTLYLASAKEKAGVKVSVAGDSSDPSDAHRKWPLGPDPISKTSDITLSKPGKLSVKLAPVSGRPVCCGAVLERKN